MEKEELKRWHYYWIWVDGRSDPEPAKYFGDGSWIRIGENIIKKIDKLRIGDEISPGEHYEVFDFDSGIIIY